MMPFLLALLLAATAATANVTAFELRAGALQSSWQAEQAAGVPAASLAEARRELRADVDRRAGPLPYAVVSGAAWSDPFAGPEATGAAAARSVEDAARRRAADALVRWTASAGPGAALARNDRLVQLYQA